MTISFDGASKLISLSLGTTSLSVKDLWSRWVDWLSIGDNSKWLPAMSQVGGNTIDATAGTAIPPYIYLINGWRIRPQEANHTLSVTDGVLLVDGGGDPFVNTLGSFVIRINYSQPVQAITVTTGGGVGTVEEVANAVWDASATSHNTVGTTGAKLNSAGSSGDPWTADLSSYTSGTAGHYIYNKILTVAKFLGLK